MANATVIIISTKASHTGWYIANRSSRRYHVVVTLAVGESRLMMPAMLGGEAKIYYHTFLINVIA